MSAPVVRYHTLGRNGPSVPAIGFGLMSMSYMAYGTPLSDEKQFALLDRAVELGATFWDTAE
jgi:aryl-alcohol dehydrogenase-like predicted oxidoreductase